MTKSPKSKQVVISAFADNRLHKHRADDLIRKIENSNKILDDIVLLCAFANKPTNQNQNGQLELGKFVSDIADSSCAYLAVKVPGTLSNTSSDEWLMPKLPARGSGARQRSLTLQRSGYTSWYIKDTSIKAAKYYKTNVAMLSWLMGGARGKSNKNCVLVNGGELFTPVVEQDKYGNPYYITEAEFYTTSKLHFCKTCDKPFKSKDTLLSHRSTIAHLSNKLQAAVPEGYERVYNQALTNAVLRKEVKGIAVAVKPHVYVPPEVREVERMWHKNKPAGMDLVEFVTSALSGNKDDNMG